MPPYTGTSRSQPRWRSVLDVAASVAVICVSLTAMWAALVDRRHGERTPQPRREERAVPVGTLISLEGAVIKGSETARLAIIEYADFQCPYCASFATRTLPALERSYINSGKALMAFRHLPLSTIHQHALRAAHAAECAARQGKFWEVHDLLFQRLANVDNSALRVAAVALGLQAGPFETCLAGEAGDHIKADIASAAALGIAGTPTFLLGLVQSEGRVRVARTLSGNQSFENMQRAISDVLAQQGNAQ